MKLAKFDNKPEIFYTIQGEGKNIGMPSIFIRLSMCNLYCIWCDTDYTWNWEGTRYTHINDTKPGYSKFKKDEYMMDLSIERMLDILAEFACKNIVITGGEPMIQHKELSLFLKNLKNANPGYHIEMETNGTISPSLPLDELIDQFNVSVKLSNSGVRERDRIVKQSILFFSESPKSNFKFVIDSQKDVSEVIVLMNTFNIPKNKIYLMPQGMTVEKLKQKQMWLVEVCKQYGFNYTDRIHIHIYGNRRGV